MNRWRIGSKVPVNIYDETGRPVCQCHTAIDAKRIVDAVNNVAILRTDAAEARVKAISECIHEISTGRTANNFGHVPSVVRALEWVMQDLLKLQAEKPKPEVPA